MKGINLEILYLLPGSGMPEEELERRTKITNQISRPDANVTAIEVGVGPLSIESAIEEYMSIGPMLEWLRSNREEGKYDAIIIGCAGDLDRPNHHIILRVWFLIDLVFYLLHRLVWSQMIQFECMYAN
jgi:hypothetical protein